MPLGDPGGGSFRYTVEGLPENITAVTIPVTDMERSVAFYSKIMRMEIISRSDDTSVMGFCGSMIILKKKDAAGVNTGIYIGVYDPFEFHRRMVDEGVVFVRHPERGSIGVYASFRDPDSNVLHAVEKRDRTRTYTVEPSEPEVRGCRRC